MRQQRDFIYINFKFKLNAYHLFFITINCMSKLFKNKKYTIIFIFIFFISILFTRLYNLNQTARFTRDESSDLGRMHQYFQNRKITLVGPISSENDKVFSSLSYYLLMPFAAIMNFRPIGPVYGTAFWGIITAGLLLLLINNVNSKKIYLGGLILISWYPLLTMSRWAWNPHFVLLWSALAFLAYFYHDRLKKWGIFFTGLFLGLMFHHHYVSIFATAPFILLITWQALRQKKYQQVILAISGFTLPFLAFLLFDLRHPPGLFFTKYLIGGNTPHIEKSLNLTQLLSNFSRNYVVFLKTVAIYKPIQLLIGIFLPILAIVDLKTKKYKNVIWFVPVMTSLIFSVILDDFVDRYAYSALGFLLIWLLLKRKHQVGNFLANSLLGLILLSSIFSVWPQLHYNEVEPPMQVLTKASKIIEDTIKKHQLNNANVAALASPDKAPLAEKYRDVIRINGVDLKSPAEYDVSEHLFIITTSDESALEKDQSYAMIAFKTAELKQIFTINKQWKVYWYGY